MFASRARTLWCVICVGHWDVLLIGKASPYCVVTLHLSLHDQSALADNATFTGLDAFQGEWDSVEHSGKGTLTLSDGRKFVGEFKDGKRHGDGTVFNTDGIVEVTGEWKDGVYEGMVSDHVGRFFFFSSESSEFVGEVMSNLFHVSSMFSCAVRGQPEEWHEAR
jgi:hypothetical protein